MGAPDKMSTTSWCRGKEGGSALLAGPLAHTASLLQGSVQRGRAPGGKQGWGPGAGPQSHTPVAATARVVLVQLGAGQEGLGRLWGDCDPVPARPSAGGHCVLSPSTLLLPLPSPQTVKETPSPQVGTGASRMPHSHTELTPTKGLFSSFPHYSPWN